MNQLNKEITWKSWLERLLILDFFLVIISFFFFLFSVFMSFLGDNSFIYFVENFWKILFIPIITILISATLMNALINWWKSLELHKDSEN